MRRIITSFFFLVLAALGGAETSFAQGNKSSEHTSFPKWSGNLFEQKVFVENKGQFAEQTGVKEEVLFHATSSGVNIYFTKQGVVYCYDEIVPRGGNNPSSPLRQTEEKEEDKEEIEIKHHLLKMQWLGSNLSVKVSAKDKVPFYHTYSFDMKKAQEVRQRTDSQGRGIRAEAYKKIIYHNLYPNIDVEYIFPEDKDGIKYSLIVHPGANLGDIKMKWKGDDLPVADVSGNIIIKSSFGEKVFETTNPIEEWDGSYKGKLEGTSVFAYYMKVTLITGDKIIKKGNVSLLK